MTTHPYDEPQVFKRWWPDAVEITPHDIAQLAETRRRDPDLALRIAEESARSSSQSQIKEARKL